MSVIVVSKIQMTVASFQIQAASKIRSWSLWGCRLEGCLQISDPEDVAKCCKCWDSHILPGPGGDPNCCCSTEENRWGACISGILVLICWEAENRDQLARTHVMRSDHVPSIGVSLVSRQDHRTIINSVFVFSDGSGSAIFVSPQNKVVMPPLSTAQWPQPYI